MLKETMTYEGFDGEKYTEDFYFNLTEAEVSALELSVNEIGLAEYLKLIVKTNDQSKQVEYFQKFIDVSYGVLSADGKRFLKSPEILAEFKGLNAYSDLFMRLATDHEFAARFINGIMPARLAERAATMSAAAGEKSASDLARERSEAQMQGHRAPVEREPETVQAPLPSPPVEVAPDQTQASPPVQAPPVLPTSTPIFDETVAGRENPNQDNDQSWRQGDGRTGLTPPPVRPPYNQ